jgi:RNA-dependent RNA polymerase
MGSHQGSAFSISLFREVKLPALEIAEQGARQLRLKLDRGESRAPTVEIKAEVDIVQPGWHKEIQEAVDKSVSKFITLVEPSLGQIDETNQLLHNYTAQLQAICSANALSHARNAVLTEEEIVVGTIVAKTSQPRLRKDAMSRVREQSASLVREVREDLEGDDDDSNEAWLHRAWVAWRVAIADAESDKFGSMSFWWIALGSVLDAVRALESREVV